MIDPVQSIQSNAVVHAARVQTPELQTLSDSFNRLMAKEPDPSVYSEQHAEKNGPTAATAFVRAQESMMHRMYDDVRAFSVQAPSMGMQELASRHIDLTYKVAMVQLQFNAGVYLAQSGKTGIQTLMRNQ